MFLTTQQVVHHRFHQGKKYLQADKLNGQVTTGREKQRFLASWILVETQLSNVPQNAFNGLSNLETIKIHRNPLSRIDGNAFKGLSRLEDFLATKNNLHTLPDGIFSDLVNLKMLKLGHNKITSISSNLLSGLRKLEFLSMPNNKISHVSETAFDSVASSLLTLHLKHNDFRIIRPTAKAIFDKIAGRKGEIRISQNPLVCSKDLVWLQTWMRNNALIVRDEDEVTCLTPYGNLSKVRDFDFSTL
ncbi:Immunoglobulin superfamily containing leucine-rich repeat protein, partial [Acropora cervicornis]